MSRQKELFEIIQSLPSELRDNLKEQIENAATPEEFFRMAMIGSCPFCGSDNIMDCQQTKINDITVGFCGDCSRNWCLECNHELFSWPCPHWKICESCQFLDTTGDGFMCRAEADPFDCSIIKEKMNEIGQTKVNIITNQPKEVNHSMKESKTRGENPKKNDLVDKSPFPNISTYQYAPGEEQTAVLHVASLDEEEDISVHLDAEDDVEISMDYDQVTYRPDLCAMCDHLFEKKLIYTDGHAFFCNECAKNMGESVTTVV